MPGFQRIEPQPLMGGVLIDEPDGIVVVLADDIGFQHLAHHAPGRFFYRLQRLLLRLTGQGYLRLRGRVHRIPILL